MILRAVFWIGVVSLLMPHEPNLGYGRPSAAQWWPGAVLSWVDSAIGKPDEICQSSPATCKTVLKGVDGGQGFAIRGLSEAKADIEQAERERSHAE